MSNDPADSDLRPVALQDLRPLADGLAWVVEHHLEDLPSLTPVRGRVRAVHRGTMLEVEGEAATILTLRCDRCLRHFNHPLQFQTTELIWLGETARQQGLDTELLEGPALALELDPDALTESLDPRGGFDPAHWIFEQLHLRLPLVNRCGGDCPGPDAWSLDGGGGDPRWAGLAGLRPPPAEAP